MGVSKDTKKGLRFIKEASDGNVVEALLEMAKIYEEGRYIEKNLKSALNNYIKLKNRGFIDEEDNIGRIKEILEY